MSKYATAPLAHEQAAQRARTYANSVVRASAKRTGKQGSVHQWIDVYLSRYRYLTGRVRYVGPPPVWVPAEAKPRRH